MRIISCFAILLALICLASCTQPPAAAVQQSSVTKWEYQQLADYLSHVPGIRSICPWNETYGSGACIETEHYQIYTTLNDPLMLRQVPSFVESAYKAYQSQVPDIIPFTGKFQTYLFANRQQWETFTRNFAGPDAEVYLKIQRGAYAKDGKCIVYNLGRSQTFSIIGHEGWHQFNQHHFKYRLPSWLDEGVATLFETCHFYQGQFRFEPQSNLMRLAILKRAIRTSKLIPLATLIELNPGQIIASSNDAEDALIFYAQNYAFVRFLREYKYGQRLQNYHNLLLGGLRGNWPVESVLAEMAGNRDIPLTVGWNSNISPQLFTLYIGKDMETIEQQYRQFCGEIVYSVRLGEDTAKTK